MKNAEKNSYAWKNHEMLKLMKYHGKIVEFDLKRLTWLQIFQNTISLDSLARSVIFKSYTSLKN